MHNFLSLFTPFKINKMTLRNRLYVPAMGTNYGDEEGFITPKLIAYYEKRAAGGFSLITTEVISIDPMGNAGPNQPGLWDDKFIPGWKKLADAVHKHGAKLSAQLHHAGRQTVPPNLGGRCAEAPSPIPCPACGGKVTELTTADVYRLIDCFVSAAERAYKAGVDAVEIHGAHGYLIAEFMSAYSNVRIDEFGGNLENRMRFPITIVKKIREKLGEDYPILFRISGEETAIGGRKIMETRAVIRMLEEAGIDAISISAGTYFDMKNIWGPSDFPPANNEHFAAAVKSGTKLPVLLAGRINDPYIAEEIIMSDHADMIAIGRQSIADPDFPKKLQNESLESIIPCIACHQRCTQNILMGKQIACAMNPLTGREDSVQILPTEKPKKVMVIGAGPAGLMVSAVLAQRGHSVDLYEKSNTIGGQYRLAAYPPGKQELTKVIRHFLYDIKKYGVRLHLEKEITPEFLADSQFDSIVLATGGVPLLPPINNINIPSLLYAVDVFQDRSLITGRKILIAGGGMVGAELADFLGGYGLDVTVIEMRGDIALDLPMMPRITLMERLKKQQLKIITDAEISSFFNDGIAIERNNAVEELRGFDHVVLALGTRSYNPLEEYARDLCAEVYVIGDAAKAAKVDTALEEALNVALNI